MFWNAASSGQFESSWLHLQDARDDADYLMKHLADPG